MKTTLFDLWNGNLCPHRQKTEWYGERTEIIGYIENQTQELSELLNDKGKKILNNLNDNYVELRSLEKESAFVQGFSLATKLLFEAIEN